MRGSVSNSSGLRIVYSALFTPTLALLNTIEPVMRSSSGIGTNRTVLAGTNILVHEIHGLEMCLGIATCQSRFDSDVTIYGRIDTDADCGPRMSGSFIKPVCIFKE